MNPAAQMRGRVGTSGLASHFHFAR
jgi:hypothetical protein